MSLKNCCIVFLDGTEISVRLDQDLADEREEWEFERYPDMSDSHAGWSLVRYSHMTKRGVTVFKEIKDELESTANKEAR